MDIQNSVYYDDLSSLVKDQLEIVCSEMSLDRRGRQSELATRIWKIIHADSAQKSRFLESSKNSVLAGRTSVVWYGHINGHSLTGCKSALIESLGFNPFTHPLPYPEIMPDEPRLLAAAEDPDFPGYFLRIAVKTNERDVFRGTQPETQTSGTVATVYVDEESGFLEIRADSSLAKRVRDYIAVLSRMQISLEPIPFMVRFRDDMAEIAAGLSGNLYESAAEPRQRDTTTEHAMAVLGVLQALDRHFVHRQDAEFLHELNAAVAGLDERARVLPFTVLLLAGLHKVGLSVPADRAQLPGHPLYDYLQPFLLHTGGYIRFVCPHDGIRHTLRVTRKANSVQFLTPATERAIEYVREGLLGRSR